jgi:hypothetical protein
MKAIHFQALKQSGLDPSGGRLLCVRACQASRDTGQAHEHNQR